MDQNSNPRGPRAGRPRNQAGRLQYVFWGLFALLIGVLLGAYTERYVIRWARPVGSVQLSADEVAEQEAVLRQTEVYLRGLRARLDASGSELVIERAARSELETQLESAQLEIGRVRDQLAFYEQLLPPGPEGTVEVRGLQLDPVGGGLRYKVLLMRSGHAGGAPFSGALRFKGEGRLHGATVVLDLAPMQFNSDGGEITAAGSAAAPLTLQFEQYQRVEGMLAVPEGFVPERVTVTVLEGASVRATRSQNF